MASHVDIHPTVEQCRRINQVTCPIEDCEQIFTSESNLTMHIEKTHKRNNLKSSPMEKHYFCPGANCPWSHDKYFKNMKNLRQHYLKVHTEKIHNCVSCQKSFASNVLLSKHKEFCNVTFTCLDCKAYYGSYETLRTHCRRKRHRILHKLQYKIRDGSNQVKSEICLGSDQLILAPKKSASEEMLLGGSKSFNINQNSQTDVERPVLKSKMTQVSENDEFSVSQATQHTQTGSKNVVLSVETQTIGDFFNAKGKGEDFEDNFRDINTQTDVVESKESSSNTSFNLGDFEMTFDSQTEKNTSSTQTCWPDQDIFNISTATHDSIHTDTSDLLTDTLSHFDSNFFNCNTETQTDFMFENEIFNSDYYSNMYTQTCDDILSGFNGFNDNQTQTALHETLRSVESQTLMSSVDKLCPNVLKDIVHSETQTDAEFRQMLEIINS